MGTHLEIMDTTLRDGEQTPGVSFTPEEKLQIARSLLGRLGVDRVEVASARVSVGEAEGASRIIDWADRNGKRDRVEILGFVDGGKSVEWIKNVGGEVVNLLTKGSERHCRMQLRKTPRQHLDDIKKVVERAEKVGVRVNVYLEDWSGGVTENFQYVHSMVSELKEFPVERFMLPDTLGIMNPKMMGLYLEWMFEGFPECKFDFHGHNDYGLGVANSLQAALCGIGGIHTTVNGLGERAGNPSLCEIVPVIRDMTNRKVRAKEKELARVSLLVQTFSGKRLAPNAPIVGNDVFTQTCGVHADGDKKGDLYANPLLPSRFGRRRSYALGKLSGKASIDKNLEELGVELDNETRDRVLREVIRLGDKKKKLTPADLPVIISDVMRSGTDKVVEFTGYEIATRRGKLPMARVKMKYGSKTLAASATGDGGYDAFMKAVRKMLKEKGVKAPRLVGYEVHIPPGGKTDAIVEATISWDNGLDPVYSTIGVDSDQIEAAIQATEKMLNLEASK